MFPLRKEQLHLLIIVPLKDTLISFMYEGLVCGALSLCPSCITANVSGWKAKAPQNKAKTP